MAAQGGDRLKLEDFDVSRLPRWTRKPARRAQAFAVKYQDHTVVAMAQRFLAIGGTDRALSIGAHAFVAFVPLVLLITSRLRVNGDSVLAHRFIHNYHLHGQAAVATRSLFNTPGGVSHQGWFSFAFSILAGVFTALALTAAMQRAFEAAWGLKKIGPRGRVLGVAGIAALLVEILLLSLIGTIVKGTAGGPLHLIFRLLVATIFWLIITWLLLDRRVGFRALLPGAVVSGVGSAAVHFWTGIYMPRVTASNAERYGAIGITFAIMTWLYILGVVVVLGAVVSAQLGGARIVRRSDAPQA